MYKILFFLYLIQKNMLIHHIIDLNYFEKKFFLLNSIFFISGKTIVSFGIKIDIKIKNTTDTVTYGKSNRKNDTNEIYITILWGAPIGRTIQPTLATMVCRETAIIIKSSLSNFFKVNIANGTKIINATSLVINIELKKQANTKNNTKLRVFLTLISNLRTNISKTDKFFKISTNNIIRKSNIIVSQLI